MRINMITKKILKLLMENGEIKEFLKDHENFQILFKKLNKSKIMRISYEYPNFLKSESINQMNIEQKSHSIKENPSFLCFTLVKSDHNIKNYIKTKKLKIYIDELNNSIYKILKN